MSAVIAYGGGGPGEFFSAQSIMHEYVFGVFLDLKTFTFPPFIFGLAWIATLPEILPAFFMGLYENLTSVELYEASQV